MALTKDFKNTILARAHDDPQFRRALLRASYFLTFETSFRGYF